MSQLIFMLILFSIVLLRAFYLRRHALSVSPETACTTMGGWILIISAASYPIFSELAHEAFYILKDNPYFVVIAMLKGIGLWVMNYAGQIIRKTSNSSAGFYGFICIGLIAVGNSLFGEDLSWMQWGSVIALTIMGLYFALRGHLSLQSPYVQLMFVLMVFVGCLFGVIDHFFLSTVNWYGLLVVSGFSMFFFSVLFGKMKLVDVKECMFGKKNIQFGLLVGMTELIILSILVTHVPVTLAWVAMTLAGPALMLIAAVFWNEGNWKEQLAVGGASYAAAIPIVIGI